MVLTIKDVIGSPQVKCASIHRTMAFCIQSINAF